MSSFFHDKHSFCCKCRGADCNFENRCDECMSWSVEEMESYVKLRKSLAGKSHSKKSGGGKALSSPRPVAPVASLSLADVDERIFSHFVSLSQSFDRKFDLLASAILERFTELANSMSTRLSNSSFSAEPEVLVRKPFHGQDPSFSPPVGIGGCHRQFQGEGEDLVPRSSGYTYPSGEFLDRDVSIGSRAVQSQAPLFGSSGPVQSQELLRRAHVSFEASTGPSPVDPDNEEEEEDDCDSVVSASPIINKAFACLVSFVYDQYPEPRPLSSPPFPPHCGFENLYAVAGPPGYSRPKLRLYPRESEIMSQTQDRFAKLAHEAKPLHRVLPLKRRIFNVANDPEFTTPLLVNSG